MSEAYISQSYVSQRLKFRCYPQAGFVLAFSEELNGFLNSHLEYLVDIFSMEPYIEDITFVPHPLACVTGQFNVCHELHLNPYDTFSLAFLATASLNVE